MAAKFHRHWAELIAVAFLILGFMLALLLREPVLSYLIIFLGGGLAGRILYIKHASEPILPFALIMVGFLFGYLVGGIWASRTVSLALFILGWGLSYYLHTKKIITTFKSDLFVK